MQARFVQGGISFVIPSDVYRKEKQLWPEEPEWILLQG